MIHHYLNELSSKSYVSVREPGSNHSQRRGSNAKAEAEISFAAMNKGMFSVGRVKEWIP